MPCCCLPGDPLFEPQTWHQGLRLNQIIQSILIQSMLIQSALQLIFTRWSKLLPVVTLVCSKVETKHIDSFPIFNSIAVSFSALILLSCLVYVLLQKKVGD